MAISTTWMSFRSITACHCVPVSSQPQREAISWSRARVPAANKFALEMERSIEEPVHLLKGVGVSPAHESLADHGYVECLLRLPLDVFR